MNKKNVNKKKLGKKCRENMMKQGDNMNQEMKMKGKRNLSNENLEQAFIHILNDKIILVEKKADFKVLRKKDNGSKDEGKSIEKSDDPIRMYLREMGGVELLSREG
jgi:RNA polymerase primary sigma factor